MKEIWKDVKDYEGLYRISNLGRVKSIKRNKILKNQINNKGYFYIQLWRDGISVSNPIHRLVAIAFIPNPNSYPEVNHKNGIKMDNRIEKLEWVSAKQNTQHAFEMGLQIPKKGEQCFLSKLTSKDVSKIRQMKIINPTLTNRYLAKMFDVSDRNIGYIINGDTWKSI